MATTDIVIIGAGAAGISAATKLIENGFNNVIVLEAENRIGGRIHSIPYQDNDKFIDMGAQWVHGEKNNIVYEMLRNKFSFGQTGFDDNYMTYLLSNGSSLEQNDYRKLYELSTKIIEASDEEDEFEGSLGDYFLKQFNEKLKEAKYKGIDVKIVNHVIELMEREMNAFYASKSWFEISMKIYSEYDDADGFQYHTWRDKGYKTLFDYITVKILIIFNFK
jgi:monoamine oxidase